MKTKIDSTFLQTGLRCPEGRSRIEYVDADCPGLFLEVRATSQGTGTWWLRYRTRDSRATKYARIGKLSDVGLADARRAARTLRAEIALGQRDPRGEEKARRAALTFTEFFEQHYWPHARLHKRSAKRDEQLFRLRIKPKFGHLRLGEIRTAQIQAFHNELRSEGLAPATCDLHLAFLKHAFAHAQRLDLLATANPASAVRLFRVDNKTERRLEAEQLDRLVSTLDGAAEEGSTVALVALLLLSTGARLNEALSAKWAEIDLANRVWKIAAVNSKSKRVRSVPLNDSALSVLQRAGTRGKFDHVFVNPKTGKRYVAVRKVRLRLCRKAGLPGLRLHDLRHQYASLLVSGGRSLFEVQVLLGHSSPTVTQRYAHLSTKALQEAASAASVIVRPAPQRPSTEAANAPTNDDFAEAPQRQPDGGQRAA